MYISYNEHHELVQKAHSLYMMALLKEVGIKIPANTPLLYLGLPDMLGLIFDQVVIKEEAENFYGGLSYIIDAYSDDVALLSKLGRTDYLSALLGYVKRTEHALDSDVDVFNEDYPVEKVEFLKCGDTLVGFRFWCNDVFTWQAVMEIITEAKQETDCVIRECGRA